MQKTCHHAGARTYLGGTLRNGRFTHQATITVTEWVNGVEDSATTQQAPSLPSPPTGYQGRPEPPVSSQLCSEWKRASSFRQ